jgi:hypothetical protein
MIHALSIGRMLRLAAALTVLTSPAFAQTTSHACFPNDSIIGGERIQPTQAEIEARLNTPACRTVFGDNDQGVDQSAAVQRELSRIDQEIEQQIKGLANSSATGTN